MITGTPRGDRLVGTAETDEIRALGGSDGIRADGGNDRLFGGFGADVVKGGAGDDVLHALAADRRRDVLDCGPGSDTARIRTSERARTTVISCETVALVASPSGEEQAAEEADTDAEAE